MYYTDKTTVFLDGNFVKAKDAKLDFFSQTAHYGMGVIDGIRAYSNPEGVKVFKAKDHYERLLKSSAKMNLPINYTIDQLVDITYKLLDKNNLSDAYVRPLVYTGANMHLIANREAHLFIAVWKWGSYMSNNMVDVVVSSYQRPNPKSCHVESKVAGHYVNSILATTEAKSKGADEALMLDMNGNIAQGPGTNIFFEKDKKLYTPAKGSILPGITRATIMEIARDIGIPVIEGQFTIQELTDSDAAFFTGTAAELIGIGTVEGKKLKLRWKDSLAYILVQKYRQLIKLGYYQHSTII